jgi:hypothetical protein
MRSDEKKQVEVLLMDYFRKTYPEFPKGKLKPCESPDFVLSLNTRSSLGIEITRLYPADQSKVILPPGDSSAEMRFINKVRELVEPYEQKPLFVKFLFSRNQKPDDTRMLSGASMTAISVRKILHGVKADFFKGVIRINGLPSFLNSVLVVRHNVLQSSIWEVANHQGISNDIAADIRKAILKKDEKLKIYASRNLQEYWLLITTDQLQAPLSLNIVNRLVNSQFNSLFHKVFLFELMMARIFQLV